jgi:hypothetical protein
VGSKCFYFTGDQVTGYNTLCMTVDKHHIQHLVTWVHFYIAETDLPVQGAERSVKKLLPRLAPGVESPGYLGAAE